MILGRLRSSSGLKEPNASPANDVGAGGGAGEEEEEAATVAGDKFGVTGTSGNADNVLNAAQFDLERREELGLPAIGRSVASRWNVPWLSRAEMGHGLPPAELVHLPTGPGLP